MTSFRLSRGFGAFSLSQSSMGASPLIARLEGGTFILSGGELFYDPPLKRDLDPGEFVLSGGDLTWTMTRDEVMDGGSFALTGGDLNVVGTGEPDVSQMNLYLVLSEDLTGYYLDPGAFVLTGGDLILQEVVYAEADISQANLYIVYGPEP